MSFIAGIIAFLSSAKGAMLLGFLFALSEAIGMLPGVAASGVFQAISNGIKWLKERFAPKS